MIRWRLERWRPRGVRALEVWDLPWRGGLLHERLGAPFVEVAQQRGDAEAAITRELALSLAALCELIAPKDAVRVAGGLASRPGFPEAVAALGLERVRFADERLFVGEAGGAAELARRGFGGGLVVDLGQTSIKLSVATQRRTVERPLAELPRYFVERAPPPMHVAAQQSARLAAWLSGAIAESLTSQLSLPPALVLGLPCALDAAGTPGACTYAGWAGDAGWVPRMLARVASQLPTAHAWHGAEVLVLLVNDAELAAASAQVEADANRRTLSVTLGFGPGAAWLEPARG